ARNVAAGFGLPGLCITSVDARLIGTEASAAGPASQPLDRLGRSDGKRARCSAPPGLTAGRAAPRGGNRPESRHPSSRHPRPPLLAIKLEVVQVDSPDSILLGLAGQIEEEDGIEAFSP